MPCISKEFTFKWSVPGLTERTGVEGRPITSNPISVGTAEQSTEWFLEMYPKGNTHANKDYVSVYLTLKWSAFKEVSAIFKISIIAATGVKTNELESDDTYTKFVQGNSMGFARFIPRDELFEDDKNLLPHNVLTIRCEVITKF